MPVPTQSCPFQPVPPGTPGSSALAEDIAIARVLGDLRRVLGLTIVALGDQDGDGYAEVALGGPGTSLDEWGNGNIPGEVWIFEGPLISPETMPGPFS